MAFLGKKNQKVNVFRPDYQKTAPPPPPLTVSKADSRKNSSPWSRVALVFDSRHRISHFRYSAKTENQPRAGKFNRLSNFGKSFPINRTPRSILRGMLEKRPRNEFARFRSDSKIARPENPSRASSAPGAISVQRGAFFPRRERKTSRARPTKPLFRSWKRFERKEDPSRFDADFVRFIFHFFFEENGKRGRPIARRGGV